MCRISVYVGLDYHQKSVQVCVMDQAGNIWPIAAVRTRGMPSRIRRHVSVGWQVQRSNPAQGLRTWRRSWFNERVGRPGSSGFCCADETGWG